MIYTVWCPESGQDATDGVQIAAICREEAAEKWAEQDDRNSSEYAIVDGEDTVVIVQDEPSKAQTAWRVSGEAVPSYLARREDIE